MRLLGEQARAGRLGHKLNGPGLPYRDYTRTKSPSTRRVPIIGDAFTFDAGVRSDSAIFRALLEARFNAHLKPGIGGAVKPLNAGVPGSLTSVWVELPKRVHDFGDLDVILVVLLPRDCTRTTVNDAFFNPIRDEIATRNRQSRLYLRSYLYGRARDVIDRRHVTRDYSTTMRCSCLGTVEETVEQQRAQRNVRKIACVALARGQRTA